eukprot:3721427-Alexandrium_andersonii.AAC.1
MDTGGWVLTTHLATMVRGSLDRHGKWNKKGSFNYRTFTNLIKGAATVFQMPEDVCVLFLLAIEDDKSRFERCWI